MDDVAVEIYVEAYGKWQSVPSDADQVLLNAEAIVSPCAPHWPAQGEQVVCHSADRNVVDDFLLVATTSGAQRFAVIALADWVREHPDLWESLRAIVTHRTAWVAKAPSADA